MKNQIKACGCCEGMEKLTPQSTANRPGLDALNYRVGTHAAFLETMLARLSSHYIEERLDELDEDGKPKIRRIYPLQGLKTRERTDPSIALLDAWATVADVLTFYQERIANEGFLLTATERRSVLELARLVGYKLRPGVSSSVFLAYTLDGNSTDEVIIPKGARAQSLPGPGELPQPFETSEDLKARATWNNLRPRMTRPQTEERIRKGDGKNQRIYLKGISTNLKPNDPLLIDFGSGTPEFHRVREINPDTAADRTLVILQEKANSQAEARMRTHDENKGVFLNTGLIKELTVRPSLQPLNSLRLSRGLKEQFTPHAEAGYNAVSTFSPALRETLVKAVSNARVTPENPIKVYALRVTAPLFGSNAPRKPDQLDDTKGILITKEWDFGDIEASEEITVKHGRKYSATVFLDASYDNILPDSWIVVDTGAVDVKKMLWVLPAEQPVLIAKTKNPQANMARAAYGLSGKTTRIELVDPEAELTPKAWFKIQQASIDIAAVAKPAPDDFQIIRRTIVYTQSEELKIAREPVEEAVCGGADDLLELDGFYYGLESGRWMIVSGERDIANTSGVKFSEAAMIASVQHKFDKDLPGDKTHTFIELAKNLRYCFKRDTVSIYGNVIKATHGETRKEVPGSGDGTKALQSFALKQPPLTFVSATNPSGVDSTLKVYINDVQWHEAVSLAGLSSTDRSFITKTDDDGKTTVIFGNGREGARLPTGIENIKAEYRNGIGKPGNVKSGQITLLTTRPLGVKEVLNPLRASGGADKESRDQTRKSAPLAVKALDRLVSVQDYEDFSRVYAGIGKASALELSDGRRQVVHVTVAGTDDIPIDDTSDLFVNLRQALHEFGDPHQPILLAVRELMFIVISARMRIMPDYQWEPVVTQVRSALLEAFGFGCRELGQDVLLSEVLSVMQGVRGVAYVDVDVLRGIPEKMPDPENPGQRRLLTPDEIADRVTEPLSGEDGAPPKEPLSRIRVNLADYEDGIIRPAQLAFLTPDVPATLILNQIM